MEKKIIDKTYPDLNEKKILFRRAALCLRRASMITEDTFIGIDSATACVKEAKGIFSFSDKELKSFEIKMKCRLMDIYEELEKLSTYSSATSQYLRTRKKLEVEILNRMIDVLKENR